jgi:hypothetical protein
MMLYPWWNAVYSTLFSSSSSRERERERVCVGFEGVVVCKGSMEVVVCGSKCDKVKF